MSRRSTMVVALAVALLGLAVGIGLDVVDDGESGASAPAPAVGFGGAPTCAASPTVAATVDVDHGIPAVWVVRPGGRIEVAAGRVAGQPSFAPDGQRLVVVAAQGDYESSGPDSTWLVAVGLDGSDPVAITPPGGVDEAPAWSPDGRSIAFVRTDQQVRTTSLAVVGSGGGEARSLLTAADEDWFRSPAWSPDGRSVAFIRQVEGPDLMAGTTTVEVVGVDGRPPRVVAEIAEAATLDWSGGDRLLVSGDDQNVPTRLVDPASGRVEALDGLVSQARWARGGTHVVGVRRGGGHRLVEAPLDGSTFGPDTELVDLTDLGPELDPEDHASLSSGQGAGLAVSPCSG